MVAFADLGDGVCPPGGFADVGVRDRLDARVQGAIRNMASPYPRTEPSVTHDGPGQIRGGPELQSGAARPFRFASTDTEQLHFEAGRFGEPLQLCQQALLKRPSSPAVQRRDGRILSGLERHPEACESFANALRHDPDDTGPRLGLSESLKRIGRQGEAIEILKNGIRLKPTLHLTSALADLLGVDF